MQVRRVRVGVARRAHVADHVAPLDLRAFLQAVRVAVQVGIVVRVRQQLSDSQAPVGRNRRTSMACKKCASQVGVLCVKYKRKERANKRFVLCSASGLPLEEFTVVCKRGSSK